MLTRSAAALAIVLSLLASPAFAGATSRSFMVGAVVVRSATVSATVATVKGGVRVDQVGSRGTPAPMLLAAGELRPMPQAGSTMANAAGDMTVTILY
jgi:hypothetical protein